ncbi:MAG: hypothetical protein ABFS56_20010 [Pseudomonadota bacterium]
MTKNLLLLIVLSYAQLAYAVLPPQYQNTNDLDVMVEFIEKHPQVSSTLRSIDFADYIIYFGNDCKAVFGRKSTVKPQGWVGPAAPLEFLNSNCDIK